jgi:hypothetical protein
MPQIYNSKTAVSRESGSRFEPARLRRPRLAPRPAPRPRRKTTQYGPNGYAGERGAAPPPEQLRTPATNAPPAFPGEAAFRRIPAPLECAGHRALFDGGTISSKKGVLPVPGPPNGFYFRFPTRKNDGPSRTRHGTKPQTGRRYAVPPSPTGQARPATQITSFLGLKRPSTPPARGVARDAF